MPPVAKLINIVKSNDLGNVKMVAIREHRFPFLVKVTIQLPYARDLPSLLTKFLQLQSTFYISVCRFTIGTGLISIPEAHWLRNVAISSI